MFEDTSWQVEQIPEQCLVYMRAHKSLLVEGRLRPGVFRPKGAGMSVDWGKYSSAAATRARAKVQADNAVIRIPVLGIRKIPLEVSHSPDHERLNRAHCDVVFPSRPEDVTEARRLLAELADVVIGLAATPS